MKRRIVASTQPVSLNVVPNDEITIITQLGFQKVGPDMYAALSIDGKDVVIYDDMNGEYSVIEGGALDDAGQTVLSYLGQEDLFDKLLEDYSGLRISRRCYNVLEAVGMG